MIAILLLLIGIIFMIKGSTLGYILTSCVLVSWAVLSPIIKKSPQWKARVAWRDKIKAERIAEKALHKEEKRKLKEEEEKLMAE